MPKKVLVVIHSAYGHVKTLANSEIEGLKSQGCQVKLVQVPETLSDEVLAKMHAQKWTDLPVATLDDLLWADGIMFGLATRYGSASAQVKAFMDSTGQLWSAGKLKGKYAAVFQSTAGIGGGQETAALSFLPNLVHHGIIFVPMGYHPSLSLLECRGGSFYGAGTVAGADGSRSVSQVELDLAKFQGTEFAKIINKISE